jgi:hypothetical protein
MEFLLLLIVTLLIAITVSSLVIFLFRKPIEKIFTRIISEDIALAWKKFLIFALFVVGVASGVNLWKLERFIQPETEGTVAPVLTAEFWGLEIYRTIIQTLGGLAWALLVFFLVALIAFVIVKKKEGKTV